MHTSFYILIVNILGFLLSIVTFIVGIIQYTHTNKRNRATLIESKRPQLSIISSNNFYRDLGRHFSNKVVFDDRQVAVDLLKTQLCNSRLNKFNGIGLFNMGGGDLRNVKIIIECGNKTDNLFYPIVRKHRCIFIIPRLFNLLLSNEYNTGFQEKCIYTCSE